MTDIVERLRRQEHKTPQDAMTSYDAATEIERLRSALMILKSVNENDEFPSVFVEDVIEAALEGK